MLEKLQKLGHTIFSRHALKIAGAFLFELAVPTIPAAAYTWFVFRDTPWPWPLKDVTTVAGSIFVPIFFVTNGLFRIAHKHRQDASNKRIIDSITGGDSFPVLKFGHRTNEDGEEQVGGLWLMVNGDNSVYDVSLNLTYLERLKQCEDGKMPFVMENYMKSYQLGTLGKGYEIPLGLVADQLVLEGKGSSTFWQFDVLSGRLSFHSTCIARNGLFSQTLLARKVGKRWTIATRIMHHKFGVDSNQDREVYRKFDPDFPQSAFGELDTTIA